MAKDRSGIDSLLEGALDLMVFAPVGLALTAREELGRLVERGRTRVTGQVNVAKVFGQFALSQGQTEAAKVATRLRSQGLDATIHLAQSASELAGLFGARSSAFAEEPAALERSEAPLASGNGHAAAVSASPVSASPPGGAGGDAPREPSPQTLAIPGYDSLSAPQVVQRLAGLSAEELEAVRLYESRTRSRRTILAKVIQLQSGF